MTGSASPTIILAAGGILCRDIDGERQVMLVHRKRYDDWTLPKGKAVAGESPQDAAIREVREETGCVARLGDYVGSIGYEVAAVPKVVLFWRMSVMEQTALTDHEEVDDTAWLAPAEAQQRLTHALERTLWGEPLQ